MFGLGQRVQLSVLPKAHAGARVYLCRCIINLLGEPMMLL